jgi:hypothetical protein
VKSLTELGRMWALTQDMMLQEPFRSIPLGEEWNRAWRHCEAIARYKMGWRALWFWEC